MPPVIFWDIIGASFSQNSLHPPGQGSRGESQFPGWRGRAPDLEMQLSLNGGH